jgi:hypothetical protein
MGEPAVAGEFHAVRAMGNHVEALSCWRVTTADNAVAEGVAAALGGAPRPVGAGTGWEVATESASVRVAIVRAGSTLGFRLTGCSGLGRFDFSPSPWTVAEITRTRSTRGVAGVGGRDTGPQLMIKRVEIRTHTGVHAVHLVPLLLLPSPGGAG